MDRDEVLTVIFFLIDGLSNLTNGTFGLFCISAAISIIVNAREDAKEKRLAEKIEKMDEEDRKAFFRRSNIKRGVPAGITTIFLLCDIYRSVKKGDYSNVSIFFIVAVILFTVYFIKMIRNKKHMDSEKDTLDKDL